MMDNLWWYFFGVIAGVVSVVGSIKILGPRCCVDGCKHRAKQSVIFPLGGFVVRVGLCFTHRAHYGNGPFARRTFLRDVTYEGIGQGPDGGQ